MNFQTTLHAFMTAAGQEAENTSRPTLKYDIVLTVPDDPNAPGLRFGVGQHDWRHAYYQEPGKASELLGIAEAARRFSDYVLNKVEPPAQVTVIPDNKSGMPKLTQKARDGLLSE